MRAGQLELRFKEGRIGGEKVKRIDTDFWSQNLERRVYLAWDGEHNKKEQAVYVHIVGESQIRLQKRLDRWELWVEDYKEEKQLFGFSKNGLLEKNPVEFGNGYRIEICDLLEDKFWRLKVSSSKGEENLCLPVRLNLGGKEGAEGGI